MVRSLIPIRAPRPIAWRTSSSHTKSTGFGRDWNGCHRAGGRSPRTTGRAGPARWPRPPPGPRPGRSPASGTGVERRPRRSQFVGQPLDVQQVPRRDVVRGDVAAVAAASQRHRRIQPRRQPNRPVRRRRVDDDAERRLLEAEFEDDLVIASNGSTWCVPCRRSAGSACSARSPRASRPPRSRTVPGRAFRSTAGSRGRRPDSSTISTRVVAGHRDAGLLGDMNAPTGRRAWGWAAAAASRAAAASFRASPADRKCAPCACISRLNGSATSRSTTTEFGDEQSTPLSKLLPVTMSRRGFGHVGRALDEARRVAGSHAVRGLARAVGGAHEPHAARRQNHGDVAVLHQVLRPVERRPTASS